MRGGGVLRAPRLPAPHAFWRALQKHWHRGPKSHCWDRSPQAGLSIPNLSPTFLALLTYLRERTRHKPPSSFPRSQEVHCQTPPARRCQPPSPHTCPGRNWHRRGEGYRPPGTGGTGAAGKAVELYLRTSSQSSCPGARDGLVTLGADPPCTRKLLGGLCACVVHIHVCTGHRVGREGSFWRITLYYRTGRLTLDLRNRNVLPSLHRGCVGSWSSLGPLPANVGKAAPPAGVAATVTPRPRDVLPRGDSTEPRRESGCGVLRAPLHGNWTPAQGSLPAFWPVFRRGRVWAQDHRQHCSGEDAASDPAERVSSL